MKSEKEHLSLKNRTFNSVEVHNLGNDKKLIVINIMINNHLSRVHLDKILKNQSEKMKSFIATLIPEDSFKVVAFPVYI